MTKATKTAALTAFILFLFSLAQASAYIVLDNSIDYRYQQYERDLQYRQAVHYGIPDNTYVVYQSNTNIRDPIEDDCEYEIRRYQHYLQQQIYNRKFIDDKKPNIGRSRCNIIVDPHKKPYYHRAIFLGEDGQTYPRPFIPFYTEPVVGQDGKVVQGFGEMVYPPYTAPVPLVGETRTKARTYVHQPVYQQKTRYTAGPYYNHYSTYGKPVGIYRNTRYHYPVQFAYGGYYT